MAKVDPNMNTEKEASPRKPRGKQEKRRIWWAYIFILPQVIFFIIFTIYPIVMSYVYSVYSWAGLGPLEDFVGLENYVKILQDDLFWNAFKNTFIYMIGVTVLLMPTSLLLAFLLNNVLSKTSSVIYRVIYFIPVVTTTAIVGIVLRQMFGDDGFVNQLFMAIGLIKTPISWFGSSFLAMIIVIAIGAWKFFGMMLIYWMAGLQTLPKDVIDAARIDGCNGWQLLRHVTIPILLPVGMVILLLSVTSSLHVFDLVKTLTDGDPYYGTDMVDLFVYREAFDPDKGLPAMGYASAAGVVFGIATFIIILLLGWLLRKTQKLK